jgi:hypothetical protein
MLAHLWTIAQDSAAEISSCSRRHTSQGDVRPFHPTPCVPAESPLMSELALGHIARNVDHGLARFGSWPKLAAAAPRLWD